MVEDMDPARFIGNKMLMFKWCVSQKYVSPLHCQLGWMSGVGQKCDITINCIHAYLHGVVISNWLFIKLTWKMLDADS